MVKLRLSYFSRHAIYRFWIYRDKGSVEWCNQLPTNVQDIKGCDFWYVGGVQCVIITDVVITWNVAEEIKYDALQ